MAIDYDRLKNWPLQDLVHTYGAKDCILYALGLGLGSDPLDPEQLRFVYEANLQALPTMAVVLASPGFWIKDAPIGIDWKAVLHGEQRLTIHRPLPPSSTVVGRMKIEDIVDKGRGREALVYARRDVYDQRGGDLMCSLEATWFCRGEGGFGGPSGPVRPPHPMPSRAPDLVCDRPTLPQAGLIYRLSGDYNPLHVDPAIAAAAGFERPILHGLCTYGVAGYAVVKSVCGNEPSRLHRLDVRFSAPVFPGETIRTEIWREGEGRASFRSRTLERDVVVLNNGFAAYSSS